MVPDALIQSPEFAISIALGAAITVFLATKIGLPVSTTHGLVGALFGSGLIAVGTDFNFIKLSKTFLIPLIVSPLMAGLVSLILYIIFKKCRSMMNITKDTTFSLTVYQKKIIKINSQKLLNFLHYVSAGIVSFSRGLNDTPKIVGLLIVINTLKIEWSMLTVAIVMAIGGLINSKKVGKMMSKKITPMNSGQGFTANLVTGLLVATASIHGMPVSTTHVSVGSIFGIGTVTKKADVFIVKKILLSWLLTLPVAGLCSAITYLLILTINKNSHI